jgi:hypothetical protein
MRTRSGPTSTTATRGPRPPAIQEFTILADFAQKRDLALAHSFLTEMLNVMRTQAIASEAQVGASELRGTKL